MTDTTTTTAPDSGDYTYGTTPAGAQVTEEREPGNGRARWHKLSASLATLASLVGTAVYCVHAQPASASVIYASMAGAAVTALIAYITGNVREHQIASGLVGLAQGVVGQITGRPQKEAA